MRGEDGSNEPSHMARRLGPVRSRLAHVCGSAAGFTLTELLIVVGLMATVAGMAVLLMPGAWTPPAPTAGRAPPAALRAAREQAIAQRRTIRVALAHNNQVAVTRVNVPGRAPPP